MPLPAELQMSYLDALLQDMLSRHSDILLARAYHDGIQPVYLTERQREYLELHTDNQFCLNVTRTVVTALRDKLNIIGFDTDEKAGDDGTKKQAAWIKDVWDKNKMDTLQGQLHEETLVDSEGFIILDWDRENKYPSMTIHERFTDMEANAWEGRWSDLSPDTQNKLTGTGQGVWAIYQNEDPNQKMIAAVKQWNEITAEKVEGFDSNLRRTVYYEDRIERFRMGNNGDWEKIQPDEQWLTTDKKPLGIPVIHYKNENMRPEAWDAIPPQDVVNKTWVDLLGSMDLSGFKMFVVFGIYPTTDGQPPNDDGSNVWKVGPAQFMGNANVKEGAAFHEVEGADPTPLMNTLKDQIIFIAQITSTPTDRFVITGAVASDKTLKEQERSLRDKAYNRQKSFGDSWVQAISMARRIANRFGAETYEETVSITPIWKNLQSIEELKVEKELGIPEETLWGRMGYTSDEITAIKKTAEYRMKFLTAFWTAYNAASESGQTAEQFAVALGLGKDEIQIITATAATSETIPNTDL